MQESQRLNRKGFHLIALFKLLLTIICIAHIFSTLWIFLANYEQSLGN